YVGGKIASLGVDAVPGEMTDLDAQWLENKLKLYGLEAPNGVGNMHKIVAGKQLWNYDNLEPAEKKLVLLEPVRVMVMSCIDPGGASARSGGADDAGASSSLRDAAIAPPGSTRTGS
ncbi:MAG: hypothetical protein V3R74_11370, partial [Alphaproteobacteria bacterium]